MDSNGNGKRPHFLIFFYLFEINKEDKRNCIHGKVSGKYFSNQPRTQQGSLVGRHPPSNTRSGHQKKKVGFNPGKGMFHTHPKSPNLCIAIPSPTTKEPFPHHHQQSERHCHIITNNQSRLHISSTIGESLSHHRQRVTAVTPTLV